MVVEGGVYAALLTDIQQQQQSFITVVRRVINCVDQSMSVATTTAAAAGCPIYECAQPQQSAVEQLKAYK